MTTRTTTTRTQSDKSAAMTATIDSIPRVSVQDLVIALRLFEGNLARRWKTFAYVSASPGTPNGRGTTCSQPQ